MHAVRSTISTLRDRWAPVSHTSTFLQTGEITPEEFVLAGDYLVYKFPSWSWASAASPSQQVSYLPPQKQYLVTRNVPCRRALDDNFAGQEGLLDALELDGEGMEGQGDEEGWLRTGTDGAKAVKTIRENVSADHDQIIVDDDEDDDIPDIDDEEDDDAIIRDPGASSKTPLRTYNLYITYSTYYRTPRLYLQGYKGANQPLPPQQMLDDIIGDYKDKTVTLEDFPFFPTVMSIKMASVHPCKHASVMKVLLDRANNALKIRTAKLRAGQISKENAEKGLEGLVDSTRGLSLGANANQGFDKGVVAAGGGNSDEWEVLQEDVPVESAIRVDQYLVVFLKFMASVMPGLDDLTMGI